MHKLIFICYCLLFLLVPLIFFPKSSELFEFNKMVLVYIFTTIITFLWFIRSIVTKKFIFRPTLLDLPLLLFLLSQVLATVFSIDRYTSIFGYSSRLNGGLLSTVSYLLLYWAYVSNIEKNKVFLHIKMLLLSAVLVSIWAIFEHFGHSLSCLLVTGQFDANCWVQDVQSRVFASLGQPNWLAAWIVALTPLTWGFALNSKNKNYLPYILSFVFFLTVLFTKSRSGLLGFVVADALFWSIMLFKFRTDFRNILNKFLTFNFSFLILAAIFGTPWTPSFTQTSQPITGRQSPVTALETGGTESGTIRKIVWRGALDLWRSFPLFGTGVETFAYSYYKTRPVEHNLTTEWDFLYNKAHNEYLNMAANTGSVGIISYIFLIICIILIILNSKHQEPNNVTMYEHVKQIKISKLKISNLLGSWNLDLGIYKLALMSGFVSLLITNFFGFSVVVTNLEFFLFPAFAVAVGSKSLRVEELKLKKIDTKQKIGVLISCSFTLLLFYSILRYWYADTQFAKGRHFTDQVEPERAIPYLIAAVNLNPTTASYHDQLAQAYSQMAPVSEKFVKLTIEESDSAFTLAPYNITLLKSRANIFTDLSTISPAFLVNTLETLQILVNLAPTDPSIYLRTGLALAQAGEIEKAIPFLEKALELKPNYSRAKEALDFIKNGIIAQ